MRPRNIALAIALIAAACAASAQDKWVIGQSAPLTGGNAQFGKDIRDGALAYFAMLNAKGGVQGKPIELVTLDDKNERKQAGVNTKTLLENRNLLALFGYASATLSLDALPQAEAKEVAFFAPFSGANPVRVNSPVLFTVRASYGEEMEKILNFWVSLGLKRVTVVHYDDEVGKQNLEVVVQYLKKLNLAPQALPLQRNAKVGKSEVQALMAQQPDLVLNTVLSGAAAQLQKGLVEANRIVPTSSLSFIGADQFMAAAGPSAAGVSITQVVPNPTSQVPAVRECAKALEAAGIKTPMNSTQLEACFGAKILAEGIRRAKKPVNTASVREALTNLGSYDLGGFRVTFAPGAQHGSKFVDLAMVTREGRLVSR
ncbi:MAG TPA: ABC transporter substrate-binding protein [Ramlibacter sp.]|nr:ABC transporter substrate-binding protein [Ramlibacter sp.]